MLLFLLIIDFKVSDQLTDGQKVYNSPQGRASFYLFSAFQIQNHLNFILSNSFSLVQQWLTFSLYEASVKFFLITASKKDEVCEKC